ncbi:Fungal specific transcription factor domain-containing protein isoform 2 [Cladophialophora immunda]|nr:Fungal specific transcription factor domain-containing protein isoform 2 [Cladophialophora immunda]
MNLSRLCSYPSPPDRKRLMAERRSKMNLENAHQVPVGAPRPPLDGFTKGSASGSPPIVLTPSQQQLNHNVHDDLFPSSEMAMFLIEVYFSRAYNATLLYHKERFVSHWIRRRLPSFIALSIFATASIFLRNGQSSNPPLTLADSAHDWEKVGADWANRASQLVLAHADIPSLETVQACQTLVLYWLAHGQTQRVNIHANVAYRVCRLLGINQESAADDPITAEQERRCLWACWITQCISQDNATFKGRCWNDIAGIPLPATEISYIRSEPCPYEYLTSDGEVGQIPQSSLEHPDTWSPMSELVKLAGYWWEIHDFVKQTSNCTPVEAKRHLASWMNISSRLEKIQDALPTLYRQRPALSRHSDVNIETLFSLLCLQHACACVLNASIVPLYSRWTISLNLPKKMILSAAQEVLDNASVILNMANELCSLSPDPSKISALTGYCLYFSVFVQQKYLTTQPTFGTQATESTNGAFSILNTLQDYWYPLKNFITKLREQFEQYSQRQDVDGEIQKMSQFTPGQGETQSSKGFPDIEHYVEDEVNILRKSPGGSVPLSQTFSNQARGVPNAQVVGMPRPTVGAAEKALSPRQDESGRPWPVVERSPSHFVDPNSWPWWDIGAGSNDPDELSLANICMMENGY